MTPTPTGPAVVPTLERIRRAAISSLTMTTCSSTGSASVPIPRRSGHGGQLAAV